MTDIVWGAEIAIDGKRPDWLKDSDRIIVGWHDSGKSVEDGWTPMALDQSVCDRTWGLVKSLQLPADHDYYQATDAGYKYWPGGETAPDDWDMGKVLLRDGSTCGFAQIMWWTVTDLSLIHI